MSETNKKMQLELLMEKLRHKTSHLNLADSAKSFRMTILVNNLMLVYSCKFSNNRAL